MHFYGTAPEVCVGYSRLRRFGNNQTVKPDGVNVMVDPGLHDVNPLKKEQLGRDAKLADDTSIVSIEWPFMYNLVRAERPELREIELIPRSDNFVFYTFVFG